MSAAGATTTEPPQLSGAGPVTAAATPDRVKINGTMTDYLTDICASVILSALILFIRFLHLRRSTFKSFSKCSTLSLNDLANSQCLHRFACPASRCCHAGEQ